MKRRLNLLIVCVAVSGFFSAANAQLVDNGDGTITDTEKGIMWAKKANLTGSTSLTYAEAVIWVNNLNYAGYTDWRLPAGTDPGSDPNKHTNDNQYYYNCSQSEFGNLFYNVLGGTSGLKITEMWSPTYEKVPNNDPDLTFFDGIMGVTANSSIFWTSIPRDASNNWTFSFWDGSYKAILSSAGSTYRLRAWPVRDVSGQPVSNPAPTHFAALNGYSGAVPLAWGAPDDMTGFLGYDVHRFTMEDVYTKLADRIQNQYFRDETAVNGISYCYSVSAWYTTGESDRTECVQGTAEVNGYTLQCGYASYAPAVDGHIQFPEWDTAAVIDITYPNVPNPVTLYAMNDENFLYIAVDDRGNSTLDNYDGIGIIFDEDSDRGWPETNNGQEGILQIYWNNGSVETWFQGFYGKWPSGVRGSDWTAPDGVVAQMSTLAGHVQLEVSLDLNKSPLNGSCGDVMGVFFYSMNAGTGFHGAWPQETANHLRTMTSGNAWAHGAFSFGDLEIAAAAETNVERLSAVVPAQYLLLQNYPNPFNPGTIITYAVREKGSIELKVYDISGKEVAVLVKQEQAAGTYSVVFNGEHLSGGVYLYSLRANNFTQTGKMMLIK